MYLRKKLLYRVLSFAGLVLLPFLYSCAPPAKENSLVRIKVPSDYSGAIHLSSLADASGVGYTLLESSNESMISRVDKLVLDSAGNYYLLDKDQQRLMRFSSEGKFLGDVGNGGRGPNEYIDLTDFVVTGRDSIEIYDAESGKILIYDLQGNFHRYTACESGYSQFAHVADRMFFYASCGGFCGDLKIKTGNKTDEYFVSDYKDYMVENQNSFFINYPDIYYTQLFDPVIYRITEGTPTPVFEIDYTKVTKSQDHNANGDQRILESPNNFSLRLLSDVNMYVTFFYKGELVHQFYNPLNGKNVVGTFIQNDVNYIPIGAHTFAVEDRIYSYAHVLPNKDTANYLKKMPVDKQSTLKEVMDIYSSESETDGKQVIIWFDLGK